MKRKTTLYLEDQDIRELKKIALEGTNQNMTSLITEAVHQFLDTWRQKPRSFDALFKCKGSVKKNYFGDAVNLQRSLRKKWEE